MLVLLTLGTVAASLVLEWAYHRLDRTCSVEWRTPAAWRHLAAEIAGPRGQRKPMRLQKAERQMNGPFKEA
ncbi:hypothetical protein LJR030_001464 [Rhizobium sp. LjRoot30]|uniref:hypothetical protein n=1 Tax=Rhizobium sp. LjRoot30 TaxID=3342320 RepID=UPI003ED142B1